MKPDNQSCGTCVFYFPNSETPNAGKCHRYPPTRLQPGAAAYPPVPEAEWCGEWRPSLPTPVDADALDRLNQKLLEEKDSAQPINPEQNQVTKRGPDKTVPVSAFLPHPMTVAPDTRIDTPSGQPVDATEMALRAAGIPLDTVPPPPEAKPKLAAGIHPHSAPISEVPPGDKPARRPAGPRAPAQ